MGALAAGLFQVLVQFVHRVGQVLQPLVQPAQGAEVALALLQGLFLAAHALEQFIEVHGLLVVIGKAFTQGTDHILFIRAPRQHDGFEHALPGDFLERANQFDTITVGHVQVADDKANGLVGQVALEGFVGGMGRQAVVTLGFKKLTQLFDDDWLVIDHQNLHITEWSGHNQLPVRMRPCSRARRSGSLKIVLRCDFVQGMYKVSDHRLAYWIHTAVRRKPAST